MRLSRVFRFLNGDLIIPPSTAIARAVMAVRRQKWQPQNMAWACKSQQLFPLSTIVVRRLSLLVKRQIVCRNRGQQQVREVFCRKDRTADAPVNGERRVAPQDAALVLRKVKITTLVKKLGGLAEHRVAVCE